MRNRIINGAMVIDQRNAGASVTAVNAVYTLDRWQSVSSAASKFSIQQNAGAVTPPAGFSNYLGVTSLSAYSVGAGEVFAIYQPIEGFNTADLDLGKATAKTFTLSFFVRSSLTGTFGGSLTNSAYNRSYPFSYTISAANTWEQKSITVVGDTAGTWVGATNGTGLNVQFSLGTGTTLSGTAGAWSGSTLLSATGATSVVGTNGATFYITGVQLEVGSQATSFEYRQYTTELQLCQRYFYVVGGVLSVAASSTDVRMPSVFPVQMRATPTVTANTGTNIFSRFSAAGLTQSASNATILDASNTSAVFRFQNFTGASTGDAGVMDSSSSNTSAVCYASAEL
jgi:hypothetical protein